MAVEAVFDWKAFLAENFSEEANNETETKEENKTETDTNTVTE